MNNLQGKLSNGWKVTFLPLWFKNALKEISVYLREKIMTVYTQAPDLQC